MPFKIQHIASTLLASLSKTQKIALSCVFALSSLSAAAVAVQPFFLGGATAYIVSGNTTLFMMYMLGYVATGMGSSLCGIGTGAFHVRVKETLYADMATRLAGTILADKSRFADVSLSKVLVSFEKVKSAVHVAISDLLEDIVPYILSLSILFALLYVKTDVYACVVGFAVLTSYVCISFRSARIELKSGRELATSKTAVSESIGHTHEIADAIRSFGAVEATLKDVSNKADAACMRARGLVRVYADKNKALEALKWCGFLLILSMEAFRYRGAVGRPEASALAGGIVSTALVYSQMLRPVSGLSKAAERVISAFVSAEEYLSFFEAITVTRDHDAWRPADRTGPLHVRIDGLQASFGGDRVGPPLTASWMAGDVIVVRGPNGIGKTSAARTLAGLVAPAGGDIRLFEGQKVPCNPADLRRHVIYVPQEDLVSGRSVLQNITMGDESIAIDDVLDACEKAGVTPVVRSKGMTIDDKVGDRGGDWSGGERRRLALARALCRKADVMVLDEPTVGLDPISAESILRNFRAHMARGILIVISHERLDTFGATAIVDMGQRIGLGAH